MGISNDDVERTAETVSVLLVIAAVCSAAAAGFFLGPGWFFSFLAAFALLIAACRIALLRAQVRKK